MAYNYLEKVNPAEAAITAGFSMDGAEANGPYFVQVTNWPDDLHDHITAILGDCVQDGSGGLRRTLPKACPMFPWLFASRITRIVGQGAPTLTAITDAFGAEFGAPMLVEAGAKYAWYRLDVQFTPRPYAVSPDSAIDKTSITFNKPDGTTNTTFTVAEEWYRFTDYDIQPQPELAFAQQGNMIFRTGSTSAPHGIAFSGFPRVMLPKAMVRFRWHQVPFTYVDAVVSNLVDNVGTINQHTWYDWPAGSLLLTGVTVSKRYPPPVPARVYDSGAAEFSTWKLCDLELLFEYTSRAAVDPPTPYNANWIADGHNLQPWITDRKFYYVASAKKGDETNDDYWIPTYLSYPFELLFTDPAVSGACVYD